MNACCEMRACYFAAISRVLSVLYETSTTISSAQETAPRQASSVRSLLKVVTHTDNFSIYSPLYTPRSTAIHPPPRSFAPSARGGFRVQLTASPARRRRAPRGAHATRD